MEAREGASAVHRFSTIVFCSLFLGCLLALPFGCQGPGALSPDKAADGDDDVFSTITGDTDGYGKYRIVAAPTDAPAPRSWTFTIASDDEEPLPPDSPFRFIWDFGGDDGEAYEGLDQVYSFPRGGTFVITVTALDAGDQVAFILTLEIEIPEFPNVAPVADAGDDHSVNEGDEVCLDGSQSLDPNDDSIGFQWQQFAGAMVSLTVDADDSAVVCFTAPEVDEDVRLIFGLLVSDGELTTEDTVWVDVLDVSDTAPFVVADAGPDIETASEQAVTLDGSASYASDEGELTWWWTQTAGIPVMLSDATQAVATFAAPEVTSTAEELVFQLLVTQGDVSASDEVRVTVLPESDSHATLYFEDFDAYASGADPDDWMDTDADNSLVENDGLFKVMSISGETALGTTSEQTNIHSHYAGEDSTEWSDYTYTGRMMGTDDHNGFGVTFLSDYPNTDSYYRLRRGDYPGGYAFHISPHGTNITGGTTDTGVVPNENQWYRFKIEVENTGTQTAIRAKVWADGSAEPADWQVDCYDGGTERLTSGTIGVWSMWSGGKYWDDLHVIGAGSGGGQGDCDTDSDGDGVVDCEDVCPGQDDGVDADGNGTPDCLESPSLCVSPSVLNFGSTTTGIPFEVWNCGTGAIDYTVNDDAGWLTVSPSGGSSAGEHDTVSATVSRAGLDDGTYQAEITVVPSVGSTLSIMVSMLVQASPPGDGLIPVARWDVVPHQRIDQGETFKCGVVAFSKHGIQKIRFSVNGGLPAYVVSMTYNSRTGVYEYWIPISANDFTTSGLITVNATAYGTDGGTRMLDPLFLFVDPHGTAPRPEAWVDASSGSDSTGAVSNPAQPFATIGKAIDGIRAWMSAHGYGNKADGGIVRLNAGNHALANGGIWDEIPTVSEWVTITRAAGGTKSNTVINSYAGYIHTKLLKVEGITVRSSGQWGYIFRASSDYDGMNVWLDDCNILGPGRHISGSHPVQSSTIDYQWYTDSYVSDTDFAVQGGKLARGLTIEHIGNDAFQHCPMIVRCTADDIDPGSTGWHADAWQYFGSFNWDNLIVYDFRATDLHYQGIMCNIGDSGYAPPKNIAFVNNYFELADPISHDGPSGGALMLWKRGADHLLMWHNTFAYSGSGSSGHQAFYDNSREPDCVISNSSFAGNKWTDFRNDASSTFSPGDFMSNHYDENVGHHYHTQTPGSDVTTGNAQLDSFGRPEGSSPLLSRISPLLVPADASGMARGSVGDVGAYEH